MGVGPGRSPEMQGRRERVGRTGGKTSTSSGVGTGAGTGAGTGVANLRLNELIFKSNLKFSDSRNAESTLAAIHCIRWADERRRLRDSGGCQPEVGFKKKLLKPAI